MSVGSAKLPLATTTALRTPEPGVARAAPLNTEATATAPAAHENISCLLVMLPSATCPAGQRAIENPGIHESLCNETRRMRSQLAGGSRLAEKEVSGWRRVLARLRLRPSRLRGARPHLFDNAALTRGRP